MCALAVFGQGVQATEVGAKQVRAAFEREMADWQQKLSEAKSQEAVELTLKLKPDVKQVMKQMIREVGGSLAEPWAMEQMIWLMENTPLGVKDTQHLMNYTIKYHMMSPLLARFCFALTGANTSLPMKKQFIEKARKSIREPERQALACVALATVLEGMGDSELNDARRLKLLKTALTATALKVVDGVNIEAQIKERLYHFKYLNNGHEALGFIGKDSSGREVSLQNYRGKVVMLVFWASWDLMDPKTKSNEKTMEMLQILKKYEERYAARGMVLLGVNRDSLLNLRKMEQDGIVSGTMISDPEEVIFGQYRIARSPLCFVIDQKGVIQHIGAPDSFAALTVEALLGQAAGAAKTGASGAGAQ